MPAVQAVHKEAQEREEAEQAAAAQEADPQARAQAEEARRAREMEEWRMQQLRAGAVGDNANFGELLCGSRALWVGLWVSV